MQVTKPKVSSPIKKVEKKTNIIEEEKRNTEQASRVIRQTVQSNDPQLIRTFRGHEGAVNSVDFDPYMRQVVSGGDDGLVYVWNFLPQKRPFKFVGHKGAVLDVHFSADGESIISAGQDRQIRIWKNSVQAKSRIIKGHGGAVRNIDFSSDGKLMLSSSDDKTMKVWNFQSGKFLHSLAGHKNWVRQGQFSPDMRLVASASDDKSVKLWDFNTQQVWHTFLDHNAPVYTVKFSPDGTCVASGGEDRNIQIFDIRSEKIIQHYDAHDSAVNNVCFHQSGYYLSSASQDSQIKIWDLRMGRIGWTLYAHKDECRAFNFNARGDYFVSGGADNLVMVWNSNIEQDNSQFPRSFDPASFEEGYSQNIYQSNQIPLHQRDQNVPGVKYEGEEDFGKLQLPRPPARHEQATEEQIVEHLRQNRLSELLSVNLEKIVNQLDIVTSQLTQLDDRLSQNEENVRLLLENEKVAQIVEKYENSQQKYDQSGEGKYSNFEHFKDNRGFETGQFKNRDFVNNAPASAVANEWENEVPEREDFSDDDEEAKNNNLRNPTYEQSFGKGLLGQTQQIQNVFTHALANTADIDPEISGQNNQEVARASNLEEIDEQDLEDRDQIIDASGN